ncbi:hypothetical protein [Bacteroides sp.]
MKRKILFAIFSICVLVFVGKRVYWYSRAGGDNLNVTIINNCNECKLGKFIPFSIDIYLDNELIYKNDSIDERLYFGFSKRVSIGKHHLFVVVDSCTSFNDDFYVLPLRWISIEYPMGNPPSIEVLYELSPPVLL